MHRQTLTTDPWPYGSLPPRQVAGVLRRSWLWIAAPTLAVALGAGVFVSVVSPRYTGEAKVLLESRDPAFAKTAAERVEQVQPIDEQAVASQVQVAMSRDIARQAIRELKLVGNPEFDPGVGDAGPIQRLLMLVGLGKTTLAKAPEDRVLEAYFEKLLVYPVGKSRILAFEFRSKDSELAAKAANTISELYISSLAAAQVDTARYASTWLGTNIDTLRARVAEAEAKVETYRAKNGLIGAGGSTSNPLGAQQLGELSSQLSQARTIKADLTARVKMMKEMIKEGRAFEIPDVANNELIRRTVESRITLRAQLALESRTLLPAHPRIKELTAQLSDLETQIKAAAERIVRTLDNDSKIAGARVESLQATVDGQSDVVAKGNGSEVQLRALEREAKVQREQLESYLTRYREAAARDGESATPADARIVSRAVVPEIPSFPKKMPILAVSTILALLLSAGAVIGRHLLKTPPSRQEESANAEIAARDLDVERFGVDPDRLSYPEPLPPHAEGTEPKPEVSDAVETVSPTRAVASLPAEPLSAVTERRVRPARTQRSKTAKRHVASASKDETYELDNLVERLEAGTSQAGRCILIVETTAPSATDRGLAANLAALLARRAPTLSVDINGATARPGDVGLTDLVAGEATFPDTIHAVPGSKLHAVARGFVDTDILLEEPQGLAICLNAMSQAYDWVVCRLDARDAAYAHPLIETASASMDSVVIASDAGAEDAKLVALYRLAEAAGPGQVLVARVRNATTAIEPAPEMELRLSA